jgi:cytochrome P450
MSGIGRGDWQAGRLADRSIVGLLIGTLLAAHRVPAGALAWVWYLLAAHPEVEAKVHEEVDRS